MNRLFQIKSVPPLLKIEATKPLDILACSKDPLDILFYNLIHPLDIGLKVVKVVTLLSFTFAGSLVIRSIILLEVLGLELLSWNFTSFPNFHLATFSKKKIFHTLARFDDVSILKNDPNYTIQKG